MDGASGVLFFQRDALGNVTRLINSQGDRVESYVYDAFGNLRVFDANDQEISPSQAIQTTYTFTGRQFDPETGLYFYRARYYDPGMGRFISEDPIGFVGLDTNLFKYAINNPVNFGDRTGEEPITLGTFLAVSAFGFVFQGTIGAIQAPSGEKLSAFFKGGLVGIVTFNLAAIGGTPTIAAFSALFGNAVTSLLVLSDVFGQEAVPPDFSNSSLVCQ